MLEDGSEAPIQMQNEIIHTIYISELLEVDDV